MMLRGGEPLFFPLPGNDAFAERLAFAASGECGRLAIRDFPDGETHLQVETDPRGRDVVIVGTLRNSNELVLPLVFLADTVRELGATAVGLVAPYLAYMRQDKRFHEGEAVTSRSFAALISREVDWLLTVEPHLHRVKRIEDLYTIPATAIHVASELGSWIAAHIASPLIVGPDEESRQWAEAIAAAANAPFIVLTKIRRGDSDVVESAPDLAEHRLRTPVLVDDIVSTAQTMITTVQQFRAQGSVAPQCVAVHAVFAHNAYTELRTAGAARVVTTNTIAHQSNGVDVVPALARAIRLQLAD